MYKVFTKSGLMSLSSTESHEVILAREGYEFVGESEDLDEAMALYYADRQDETESEPDEIESFDHYLGYDRKEDYYVGDESQFEEPEVELVVEAVKPKAKKQK